MRTLRILALAAPTVLLGALAATHAGRAHALVNGRAIDAEGSGFVHLHGAMSTCTGTLIAPDTVLTSKACFTPAEVLHPDLAGWFMGSDDSDKNPLREIHTHPSLDAAVVRLTHPIASRGSAPFDLYPLESAQLVAARMTCNGYGPLTGTPQFVYGTQLTSGELTVLSANATTLNVNNSVVIGGYDQGGGCTVAHEGRTVLAGVMGVRISPIGFTETANPTSVAALRRLIAAFATWHELGASDTGMCIGVPKESLERGAMLELAACDGRPDQSWEMKALDSGNVEIRAKHSNQCLTSDGFAIQQTTCAGEITETHPARLPKQRRAEQMWQATTLPGGFVELMSVSKPGMCIDLPAGKSAPGARPTLTACNKTSRSQSWRVDATTLDAKDHRLAGPLGCASAKEARSGGQVSTDGCSGKDRQLWRFEHSEGPYFRVRSREGRYARCISTPASGAGLQETDCQGTAENQKWRIEWQAKGDYVLRAKQGGQCMVRSPQALEHKPCDPNDAKQLWSVE